MSGVCRENCAILNTAGEQPGRFMTGIHRQNGMRTSQSGAVCHTHNRRPGMAGIHMFRVRRIGIYGERAERDDP